MECLSVRTYRHVRIYVRAHAAYSDSEAEFDRVHSVFNLKRGVDGIEASARADKPLKLIRSTQKAGKIHIHADVTYPGTHTPSPADLTIESVPSAVPLVTDPSVGTAQRTVRHSGQGKRDSDRLSDEERQRMLQEVQEQQADFGVGG